MTDEEDILYEHFRLVADRGQEPVRIDKFIATHQEDTSRSRVQKAIEAAGGAYFIVRNIYAFIDIINEYASSINPDIINRISHHENDTQ